MSDSKPLDRHLNFTIDIRALALKSDSRAADARSGLLVPSPKVGLLAFQKHAGLGSVLGPDLHRRQKMQKVHHFVHSLVAPLFKTISKYIRPPKDNWFLGGWDFPFWSVSTSKEKT